MEFVIMVDMNFLIVISVAVLVIAIHAIGAGYSIKWDIPHRFIGYADRYKPSGEAHWVFWFCWLPVWWGKFNHSTSLSG